MTKQTVRRRPKTTSSSSKSATIPLPFTQIQPHLSPLLPSLSEQKVYITHVDAHAPSFKKQIFAIPVALNLAILAGLLYRLSTILPWYYSLLQQLTRGSADLATTFNAGVARAIFLRLATFLLDYVLITVVAPWPYTFFLERGGNPVAWRLRTGFRTKELVVRGSRGWGREELVGGAKRGGESAFFKTKILTALAGEVMQKTGYLMMDGSWDLEFGVMIAATRLVDEGKLELAKLDRLVFVWVGDEQAGQWAVWDEKAFERQTAEKVVDLEETSNLEGREKILLIQDKLNEMGKEDLFFRWVELIQYESTRPGGFTQERQLEAGMKVQALFEQHGVNLEEFEKTIGGLHQS